MIIDDRSEIADAVAINTGAPGLYRFGDTLNCSVSASPFDPSLYLVLIVSETFTSGGAASVRFHLASDSTGDIALDGSASIHESTGAIPLANLVAGAVIAAMPLPPVVHEKYIGLLSEIVGAAFTSGKVDALITATPNTWRARADNVT